MKGQSLVLISISVLMICTQCSINKKDKKQLVLPKDEQEFISANDSIMDAYNQAPNDLKKSAIKTIRNKQIKNALNGQFQIQNWVFILDEMQTTGSGDAILKVKMGKKPVYLETWNNTLSDIMDNTLIKQNSNLYKAISELKVGDTLSLSGNFIEDQNTFIKEGSLSEEGSISEPEYLFVFKDVKKYDPSTPISYNQHLTVPIQSDSVKIEKDVEINFSKTATYKNLLSAVEELKEGQSCEARINLASTEFEVLKNNMVKPRDAKEIVKLIRGIKEANKEIGENFSQLNNDDENQNEKAIGLWLELTKMKVERTAGYKLFKR